ITLLIGGKFKPGAERHALQTLECIQFRRAELQRRPARRRGLQRFFLPAGMAEVGLALEPDGDLRLRRLIVSLHCFAGSKQVPDDRLDFVVVKADLTETLLDFLSQRGDRGLVSAALAAARRNELIGNCQLLAVGLAVFAVSQYAERKHVR